MARKASGCGRTEYQDMIWGKPPIKKKAALVTYIRTLLACVDKQRTLDPSRSFNNSVKGDWLRYNLSRLMNSVSERSAAW